MAKTDAVWGLDIGQCALKALRCSQDESGRVVADAFDYIEYPQILTQPEADPDELVRDALRTFLERNDVRGDTVAISVSGQNGLARFVKLPPVATKTIPDMVRYEAKQQIPFKLEDVVWDFQQLPGGTEEDGITLETEVGLFAMKRDQVFRALRPLTDVGAEVDMVQLTPLAIYNYIAYDRLSDVLDNTEFDSEDPPESSVVISLGTDTTDLVITNGFRVWQRSIPLGGNHFTKALSKQLKLTFAKAEHLKRNATKAEDPKAVFKAMKPVFADLLNEIQTSIRFFQNVDKNAKIGDVVLLGNAMKMPGLKRYLEQHLELKIEQISGFNRMIGSEVVRAPGFAENVLSFSVCYGLAVQALGEGVLTTNLLPKEIFTERLIREKKPWALAAVALVLMVAAINYLGVWRSWKSADLKDYEKAIGKARSVASSAATATKNRQAAEAEYVKFKEISSSIERPMVARAGWLGVLKAVTQSLPANPDPLPELLDARSDLHITSMDYMRVTSKAKWLTNVVRNEDGKAKTIADLIAEQNRTKQDQQGGGDPEQTDTGENNSQSGNSGEPPPARAGVIVQLTGYHYHNNHPGISERHSVEGAEYVLVTLIKDLETKTITVPDKNGAPQTFPIKDLRIEDPILVETSRIDRAKRNPRFDAANPGKQPSTLGYFEFTVQFWWDEVTDEERNPKTGGQPDTVAKSDN